MLRLCMPWQSAKSTVTHQLEEQARMLAIVSVIAISLFGIAMLFLMIEKRRKPAKASPHSTSPAEAVDTIAGWPPQAVRVLTLKERQAYDIIVRAMPRNLVLAQVPLARFISVPTQNSYATWMSRVGKLSVDLLITDNSSRPVAAVEIRGPVETPTGAKRHKRTAAVLKAAGIPVHIWQEGSLPSPEQARKLLRGATDATGRDFSEDSVVDDNGRRALPVAEVKELLAQGDDMDYSYDPVASAFFDDIDSTSPASR
jgi:hypothetical protein